MTNLRSLDIRVPRRSAWIYITQAIREISEARIPLEHLSVSDCDFKRNSLQFVEAVGSLETLEKLYFSYIDGLNSNDIQFICQELRELKVVWVNANCLVPNLENLLRLIRSSEKMRNMSFFRHTRPRFPYPFANEKYCINANAYSTIMEILQQRRERIPFALDLATSAYSINVPNELMEQYKHWFTLRTSY